MSRLTRIMLAVAIAAIVVGLTLTAAVGAAAYQAGSVSVSVDEKKSGGSHIHLRLPAILIHTGLLFVPERKWREARAEATPEMIRYWPLVEAAMAGLHRSPDGLLVAVDSPDETVRITKEGSTLVIDVDDPDASVRVAVPLGAVTSVVRHLAPVRARTA